jgi:hypothetical protein
LRDWVKKINFQLGGLETDELVEGMKERVPTEEEDPREAPHEPLKPTVTGVKERSPKISGRVRLGEKKQVGKEGNDRGFKYLVSAPDRTLSGLARLCPIRSLCLGELSRLVIFKKN